MINWSTDENKFKKEHPKEHKFWSLIQRINYGLDGKKLDLSEVKKSWNQFQDKIDQPTKNYLEYLIWGKLPSSTKTSKRFST